MPILPRDVLAARPLTPTNVDLFSPAAYPDASPMAPAAGPPPITAEVRAMLRDYLRADFPSAPAHPAEGMALFDDPDLIAKVSNPSLRAGLVGLLGTSGEAAIDHVSTATTSGGQSHVYSLMYIWSS